jgi:hypothetical protein
MAISIGHNSDSSGPSTQEVSEEVIQISSLFVKRVLFKNK